MDEQITEQPKAAAGPATVLSVRSLSLRTLLARPAPMVAAPLALYALTRLVIYVAALYGAAATQVGGLSAEFAGWDGVHYLQIIAHGYPKHPDVNASSVVAYFPGFPIVARSVMKITGLTALGAGVAVSLVAGAVFIAIVTWLVASYYGPAAGRRAGLLLAVFPGSFIASLPYAEALAVTFVAAAFLVTRRNHPWWGGFLGAFATATSPLMFPIFPALVWRAWRDRDIRALGAACLSPLGFVAFMAYLWQHTGHAGTWFQEESRGLNHHFDLVAFFQSLHHWPGVGLTSMLSVAFLVLGVSALRRVKAPVEWTVYSVLVVAPGLFDSGVWLSPRVLFNAFPLVIGVAVWAKRDSFRVALGVCAALLPVIFLLYMTLGRVPGQP